MFRSIISLIFLAAAAVSFFNWTQPLLNEIKNLQIQEKDLNNALASSKELQLIRDDLLSKFNSLDSADIDRLNKLIPGQSNPMKLVMEIDDLAKNNGLLLKKIDVKEGDEKNGETGAVSLNIKLAGAYKSFVSFVKVLEKNLRLMEIKEVNFISSDWDSYEYNMKIATFYKK